MKVKKENILMLLKDLLINDKLKSFFESNPVKNINIFGNEVVIDLIINNPTLQARKKVDQLLQLAIHKEINPELKVKINFEYKSLKKENLIKGNPIKGIKSIIAISSGKGGVGKSTLTANLSVSLSKMGFKVGVLDADIYGPSIPTMMDVEGSRPLSINVEGKSKMKPVENYGVKILSIGFFTKPDQAVIWRGPMATKALNQMIFDAAWGDLDFLMIDLPPGTGDIHLSIVQSLPLSGSVVVSTPQNVALDAAKKGIAMFRQENIKVPVLGIIENMSYFTPYELPENKYYIFGKSGAKNLSKDMNVPFLGELPIEQSIRESGDFGSPAALQDKTNVSSAFEIVTKRMLNELIKRNKNLPPTEVVRITTMSGCSALKN
ncbi:MAG: Mrp/NBP35 family ATP-binding protein [Flavobacteriaceae bacterium]